MRNELRWDRWKELDDKTRTTSVRRAAAAVAEDSRRFGEPLLVPFGPDDDAYPIGLVEDLDTGTWFALVPGGTFKPGLDDAQMRAFWSLEKAWLRVLEHPSAHEQPYTATGWSPEKLRQRGAVDVAPMFVAIQPLSAQALKTKAPRSSSRPLLTWKSANAAAARLRYEIPSSDELEWATSAGVASLFYWGNKLTDPVDPRGAPVDLDEFEAAADEFAATYMSLADARDARWPTSNRFGLQGAAGQPVWCRGHHGEALVAGGADRYFPWQGCGEWLWLISALRVESSDIRDHQGAMLRPIIRVR